MKLPAGATGFGPGKLTGHVDHAFATACHSAARRTGGTVIAAQPAAVTPDFDAVLLGYGDERVAALRHALLNVVAFIRVPAEHVEPPLAFTDHPRLARTLGEAGFQILPAADLRQPLTAIDLSDLSAEEHQQVKYWNPATVGELLFNYWD